MLIKHGGGTQKIRQIQLPFTAKPGTLPLSSLKALTHVEETPSEQSSTSTSKRSSFSTSADQILYIMKRFFVTTKNLNESSNLSIPDENLSLTSVSVISYNIRGVLE
uniref:Uncharacterized protein n=1 Tax=Rhizophagus irregularis (strain DAOM 181602 / DAOM 197198 / MUCL 43194) TaxID=747089 RepID=U9V5N7_RHIID